MVRGVQRKSVKLLILKIFKISVKIAIAVGTVYFSLIGNEESCNFVVLGDPVWKVKKLEKMAQPGQTLMTFKAWQYAQQCLYLCEVDENLKCVNVLGFKNSLVFAQRQHGKRKNIF